MKPNIYLDIDGVLLANETNLTIGAAEFIKYAADNFEVYWLTTHCMDGTTEHAIEYLQRGSDEDLRPWLKKFKPVTWSIKKTEAIDFTKPFLWFDDDCYSGEKIDLIEHDAFHSWIEVDIAKYPDQMVHELKLLKSIIKDDGCVYSTPAINKLHDTVVDKLADTLKQQGAKNITFPDKSNKNCHKRNCDIATETIAIEVKIINPKYYEQFEDNKAKETRVNKKSWSISKTLKPGRIDDCFSEAQKQLKSRKEKIKIIALAFPLELYARPSSIKHELKGVTQITYERTRHEVRQTRTRQIDVPTKSKNVTNIDAILYIYGTSLERSLLWLLSNQDISYDLADESEDFWKVTDQTHL